MTFCIHFANERDFVSLCQVFGEAIAPGEVCVPAWLEAFWEAIPNKVEKGFTGYLKVIQ